MDIEGQIKEFNRQVFDEQVDLHLTDAERRAYFAELHQACDDFDTLINGRQCLSSEATRQDGMPIYYKAVFVGIHVVGDKTARIMVQPRVEIRAHSTQRTLEIIALNGDVSLFKNTGPFYENNSVYIDDFKIEDGSYDPAAWKSWAVVRDFANILQDTIKYSAKTDPLMP